MRSNSTDLKFFCFISTDIFEPHRHYVRCIMKWIVYLSFCCLVYFSFGQDENIEGKLATLQQYWNFTIRVLVLNFKAYLLSLFEAS